MNGGVHGITMEESADQTVKDPATPSDVGCEGPKTSENNGIEDGSENGNHSDEEAPDKPAENGTVSDEQPDHSTSENGDHSSDKCDKEPVTSESPTEPVNDEKGNNLAETCNNESSSVPTQENSNNKSINNNCSNNNESHPEGSSSQEKSEGTDEQGSPSQDTEEKDGKDPENEPKKTVEPDEVINEIDSGSSDEDCSMLSDGPRETVSIDSDSDSGDSDSHSGRARNKSNDVIILENDNSSHTVNGNSCGSSSPEVHDITSDNDDNDDCIAVDKVEEEPTKSLRRSSRSRKRKSYIDDEAENGESDIEEVEMEDPLCGNSKPIIISNTKNLVEMATKKMKRHNDEPTIVIIDSKSGKTQNAQARKPNTMTSTVQSLYQSIVARGTTVTPIVSKANTATQSSPQTTQPNILPSLTDDMFVVEAPSFIVPYVYEKPSVKPFREFVDLLGKDLEEQKAKEEKERLEKEKEEKEQRAKLRQERRDKGEEVSESEDEEAVKKKLERKERRRRRKQDDDASWDGESSSDSEDEATLSDGEPEGKDKADSVDDTEIGAGKTKDKSDSYFDCELGKFFVNIGLNLVQEHVQTDLLKQQTRKLAREKKTGHNTRQTQTAIASLMKNLEFSKENNAPYKFGLKKCHLCNFKTESSIILDYHLETPHIQNKLYKCNHCEYEIRSPVEIIKHIKEAHNIRGRLETNPDFQQCPNCPFEDNNKAKMARHQISCAKRFKPEQNLAPPIEWEPPAKIPKIARARNNMMTYQNAFSKQVGNPMVRTPVNVSSLMPGGGFKPRGRTNAPPPRPVQGLPIRGAPASRSASSLPNNFTVQSSKSKSQPSISITPLPRQPQPSQTGPQTKNTFVICEICDGYIKDLQQLRNHMQWIHKVKIHPKMIYNRPPLNCQKCQFRFFTDQGLERHLLGSHGLVTSSMQEAANKGKDAGRCPVCGRVYQWKLLNHVAKDHNLTLKPAHLSYKCTVCTATFGMYKQFESHVYSAHSVVAKRVMDKSKTPTKPVESQKSMKINDEITITPQPGKATTSATAK